MCVCFLLYSSGGTYGSRPFGKGNTTGDEEGDVDPRLKNIEPKMIELINNEVGGNV